MTSPGMRPTLVVAIYGVYTPATLKSCSIGEVWDLLQSSSRTINHAAVNARPRTIDTTSMALQRRTFGPQKPTAPERIPFVLPGRRTLSEHLPAEVVEVPINVAQRSRYLRKAIVQQALNDPTNRQIRLPGIDSMGFRIYAEWLKTGQVKSHAPTTSTSSSGLLLRDSFDLIFAHIAGSQLEEPGFQDYIIDTLARLLDPSQTPDLKVLEVVFLERSASNILKQFVVDRMFAIERKMLGMMRGSLDGSESAVCCAYHVHKTGECYRNNAKSDLANEGNLANKSHEVNDHSTYSLHTSGQQPQSPYAVNLQTFASANTTPYNMAEGTYFGFTEWSREVHGLKQRARTRNLCTNKPLPTIPPLKPGTSRSPSSSPDSLHFSDPLKTGSRVISTHGIVQECLERLQRSENPLGRSVASSDSHRVDIPVLVLECLERFKKASTETFSTSSSESSRSHSNERSSPNDSNLLEEHKPNSPYLRSLDNPPSPCQRSSGWSFGSLPKPALLQTQTEPPPSPNTHPLRSDSSQSFPVLPARTPTVSRKSIPLHPESSQSFPIPPTRTPTVQRKSVPLRGEDWLQQYNTINAMMNNTSVMMAKPSKKSRFKELLRSDSISNRYELEGSVLIARHDSQAL
jgi:hypothetical protein